MTAFRSAAASLFFRHFLEPDPIGYLTQDAVFTAHDLIVVLVRRAGQNCCAPAVERLDV